MSDLVITNARVLTLAGAFSLRRGPTLRDLAILPQADVAFSNGMIAAVGPSLTHPGPRLDARGRVLMPAFVDCHTHACWAGSRVDEWERKLAGESYQSIMAAGGGILSTVRAVRRAPRDDLHRLLVGRLFAMLAQGTATAEVKSGYGLSPDAELRMLDVISGVTAEDWPGTVVPTALLGHSIDPDLPHQVDVTISQTLPAVARRWPGIAVDAFCEGGAWSLDECTRLFSAAKALGHPIRVHADQFSSLGMIPRAIEFGARSVDHLEASTAEDLARLARSSVAGVALPICGFHLDGRFAKLRTVIDQGGAVCIATNYNPGSAPSPSMPLAIALAVRHCGLTPAEAIAAATINPAVVLGFSDRGQIAPGLRADCLLLATDDERDLAYAPASSIIDAVYVGGNAVTIRS